MSVSNSEQATGAMSDAAPLSGAVHEALALDRLVHEPARLAILAVLNSAAEVDFAFLLAATGLSKGNLSKQASKLEEAGYITMHKYFRGKIPATSYRITPVGRVAFAAYWERISNLGESIQSAQLDADDELRSLNAQS